jgi:serine/threonine-protein kinase HipA
VKKTPLNVFASGILSGRLTRSDREEDIVLFGYRNDCPGEAAVSLTMPVRADQYDAMGGLLPIFEMNLPEGLLKETLRNRFAKVVPEFDDLDLLAIVGSSQIGRLRYTTRENLDEQIPDQNLQELLTHEGSADLFAHLLDRFAAYSGVSGVQPKVLVREQLTADRVAHRGATHIVKAFDASRYPELAVNEFICTRGAAAAGIKTAHVRLSENRRFLVVDRFDLTSDGTYLGIEDFCCLEGRRAHGRYDGSYEGISKRLTDFISTEALTLAREQFALMVVYSCAIENGDAHLKNFSVLYAEPDGRIELAPAYDLVSTTPYIPNDTLALSLGGTKRFPNRKGLIQFVRHTTGGTERMAGQLLAQTAHGVNVAAETAKKYAKRYPAAGPFIDRLLATLSRGAALIG